MKSTESGRSMARTRSARKMKLPFSTPTTTSERARVVAGDLLAERRHPRREVGLGDEHVDALALAGLDMASYTYALFMISPKPPPPGTMYWCSSRPRSSSQRVPGTVARTSGGERPRSSRSA